MKLSMLLPPKYDARKWTLAKQIGVDYAITKAIPSLSGKPAPYDFKALKSIQEEFDDAGLQLYGLEGDQFDMSAIKLGLPGRDEWIEKYQTMIRNMGRLGIPLLCYNFMASIGWFRTRVNVPERGGALCSEFDFKKVQDELVDEHLQITEDKLWDNLFYFLDAVLPIAEEEGVQMALHPDDPPVSPLKGVGRILTNAAAFDRIIEKYPSSSNGITFCQATFRLMEEDLKSISARWIEDNRVFFIHLRDVEGDKYKFRETFHDNGPTPMAELLKHYYDCGFEGPLRPDHAPAMYGEIQKEFSGGISAGYEIMGKVFAIGYIKGILETYVNNKTDAIRHEIV
ncbi:mannonate dehydratase [Membranihabitans maritimus]|uniref:mannonate dehydratase n=1 Tax=Membranihabitans maritimus TaxID=2904244 RepID=UPI001EFFC77F|nr:mannonate dehydratase [Membranihabitans maritimus]